ncbi:MAG: hypothetical protein OEZ58_16780 [Gammaproteobacteria bacterium]|nr:hypothetical protein [Gammaproteobacteria bacterium]
MAINKKGSRKIIVDDHEFRWRATGNDGWITIVIWPVENENSKVVGNIGYHSNIVKVNEGAYVCTDQIVVTNRIISEIILHCGIEEILKSQGQLNIGQVEDIFDIENAVRGKYGENQ